MFDSNKFGKCLKKLRVERHLTMDQLGQVLNCNKSLISRWENGTRVPTVESLWILADYYGISLDELVGRGL